MCVCVGKEADKKEIAKLNQKTKNPAKLDRTKKARPTNKDVLLEIADLKNLIGIQTNYMKQLVELTWAGLDPNVKHMLNSKEPEKENDFVKSPLLAHIFAALDYYVSTKIGRPEKVDVSKDQEPLTQEQQEKAKVFAEEMAKRGRDNPLPEKAEVKVEKIEITPELKDEFDNMSDDELVGNLQKLKTLSENK